MQVKSRPRAALHVSGRRRAALRRGAPEGGTAVRTATARRAAEAAVTGPALEGALDEGVDPRLQPLEGGVRLPAGEVFLGDGLVEAPLGLGEDRPLQAVDGLPAAASATSVTTGRPRGGSAPGRSAEVVRGRREVAEPMPLVAVEAAEEAGPEERRRSPDSMRVRSSSACSSVIRPSSRAASTWSTAAARAAFSSSSDEIPRCWASESKGDEEESFCDAATAAPPPATARPAAVAARIFLDETFMHALLSVDGSGLGQAASERHLDASGSAVAADGEFDLVARLVVVDRVLELFEVATFVPATAVMTSAPVG